MNFGLSNAIIARLEDEKTMKYSNAFQCGEAVNTSVQPNYAEGKQAGDNRIVVTKKKFTLANVTLGVTTLPKIAGNVMFGHEIVDDTEEISSSNDKAKHCGYGFVKKEAIGDEDKFVGCVLLKVLFADPADEAETEGENITFKAPSVVGTATPIKGGKWRRKRHLIRKKKRMHGLQES